MAPSISNGNGTTTAKNNNDDDGNINSIKLENLLLRDEDIFQTSLNSQDYFESLAPIIKDAIQTNGLSNLITKLNEIVESKDEELNQASMESMDEINQCITTIDQIQSKSLKLNKEFYQYSSVLNKSAFELMNRKISYITIKKTVYKIETTKHVLSNCIQVLELMNKILELIKETKYFPALKLIDELLSVHISKVDNFSFAKKIVNSIPHLTKMIKDESFENLSKWLSINLERKLNIISDCLIDNIIEIQNNWDKLRFENHSLIPYKVNSKVEKALREDKFDINLFEINDLEINLNIVYDTILVYQTLDELDQLSNLYHKEWMKKYGRIIYPLTTTTSTTMDQNKEIIFTTKELDDYLNKIAGFFIMDKSLNLITKFQLRNNSQANELWNSCMSKLKPVILQNLQNYDFYDLTELADFKISVGDFLQIMDNYGYDIGELYEILMILFKDWYSPLIVMNFRRQFINSIQSDNYLATIVDTKEEFRSILKRIWTKDELSTNRDFPASLPFSEDYIHFCIQIRKLISDVLQFVSIHYGYQSKEISNIIINEIIETTLIGIAKDLEEFINKNSNNKEIIAQTYTNLEYYCFSIYQIGELLDKKIKSTILGNSNKESQSPSISLRAIDTFNKLRKYSEETIFEMVDVKIDQLLSMVEYDDFLPQNKNIDANYEVKDFADFLINLFTSIFGNLPTQLRIIGLFRAYDHIAEYFLNILKTSNQFNKTFIYNFDLDVMVIEDTFKKLDLSESDSQTVSLESTFMTLRQTINLLKNPEEFNKNNLNKFDRINYQDGLKLISKIQEYENMNTNSTGSTPNRSPNIVQRGTFPTSTSNSNFASILGSIRSTNNNNNNNSSSSRSHSRNNSQHDFDDNITETGSTMKFSSLASRLKKNNHE
ncbi:unnamed protein product [Candida verbasci]|uniref:Exocyst complex component SEC15 n=1 Tax=Candida verbasci TaxID=1227364 RepID=A0A9W4XEK6_9ASCO|nr:unnamed protein product [Candida verbasci]